jgi:hypothetical protein
MGISSDVADHDLVLYTVDLFGLVTTHRRACDKFVPCRNVDKYDWIERGMYFSFHGDTYSYWLISPDAP